jgi:alpha-ketoglutarate-dependent taurine dioxygenase
MAAVTKIKPDIGAEITGISGDGFLDPAVAAEAQSLLDAHGVLVYRDANVNDDDLEAFTRLLGPVIAFRGVEVVSLDRELSRTAVVKPGTFRWHVDGTMAEYPHQITLLTCLEPANDGSGDTEFANTYAAYDALSDGEKAELEGLQVHYSYMNRRQLKEPFMTPEAVEMLRKLPPRDRPLLWTHRTGRKSMLLGCHASEVLGWSLDESEAFLGRLLEWSTQPRFTMRHHWERGDLVLWDNTGILHRAQPYTVESGRLMHRTTVDSEERFATIGGGRANTPLVS